MVLTISTDVAPSRWTRGTPWFLPRETGIPAVPRLPEPESTIWPLVSTTTDLIPRVRRRLFASCCWSFKIAYPWWAEFNITHLVPGTAPRFASGSCVEAKRIMVTVARLHSISLQPGAQMHTDCQRGGSVLQCRRDASHRQVLLS